MKAKVVQAQLNNASANLQFGYSLLDEESMANRLSMMGIVIYDTTSSSAVETCLNDRQVNLVVLMLTMLGNDLLDSSRVSKAGLRAAYEYFEDLPAQEIDVELDALISSKLFVASDDYLIPVYVNEASHSYDGLDFSEYPLLGELKEEVTTETEADSNFSGLKGAPYEIELDEDGSPSVYKSRSIVDDASESVKSTDFDESPALTASTGSVISPALSSLHETFETVVPLSSSRYSLRARLVHKNYSELAGENEEDDDECESKQEQTLKPKKIKTEPQEAEEKQDAKARARMSSANFRLKKKRELAAKEQIIKKLRQDNEVLREELRQSRQVVSKVGRYAMFSPTYSPPATHAAQGSIDVIPQSVNNAHLTFLPPGSSSQVLDESEGLQLSAGNLRRINDGIR